jgi:hypothetical protein
MRALTTTAVIPVTTRLPATTRAKAPGTRRVSTWDRLFPRRRQATLFQRCLAVHMATAGTLSALR